MPFVDRIVEHRYDAAVDEVAVLRGQFPDDSPEELANRLIRRYAKDMALGGAVSGGAAASPVAGVAVAAASAGADATFSVGRLGEMIMAIGMVYGHDATTVDQRRSAIVTIMGLADGAAVGMSGLAARAWSRRAAPAAPAAHPEHAGACHRHGPPQGAVEAGGDQGSVESDRADPLRHRRRSRRGGQRTAGTHRGTSRVRSTSPCIP